MADSRPKSGAKRDSFDLFGLFCKKTGSKVVEITLLADFSFFSYVSYVSSNPDRP